MENECTSYNFRQFAIIVPKNCHIWWKFDVVITKIILLTFLETRCMQVMYGNKYT